MAAITPPPATALARLVWGEERLQRRCEILDAVAQSPILTQSKTPHALSRREHWTLRIQQSIELLTLKFRMGWSRQHFLDATRIIGGDVATLGVNYRIFFKNLEAQMSPEQRAYWVPKADNFEIAGSYAQTELGHGSNVKGIETTATFDPDTDEIVLHSPTLTSHKYWIGSLGVVATHALVVARLIVKGKDLGNHVFLVQVRDMHTHELVPGVVIYEHGAKSMGTFGTMDNGTMQLTNKRIPRSQMLAGMVSLDADGTYHPSTNSKHSYTSMILIRGLMSEEIGQDVSKAIVIALKYAAFRRQFNTKDGKETRVIEYASVQNRLFPALCRALAMLLLGREIKARVDDVHNANLEDLHLQTVGSKIWATEHGVRDVEVARLSCGGHGNMACTGLGAIYAQLSPTRTYEGDSYVLSQQIGNAVVKHWKKGSEPTIPALSYLGRLRDERPSSRQPEHSWLDPRAQEDFLEQRAAVSAKRHLQDTARGKDTSYDVFDLAMAHADLAYWRGFQAQIKQAPEGDRETLEALANVFSLTAMVEGLAAFAGQAYLSQTDVSNLQRAHEAAIARAAPHVDRLVEALGFTEYELDSAFARSDQTPYEALWQAAKESELNDNAFIRPSLLYARNLWRKYPSSKL